MGTSAFILDWIFFFLQITRTCIKAWMSLNFSQIQPLATSGEQNVSERNVSATEMDRHITEAKCLRRGTSRLPMFQDEMCRDNATDRNIYVRNIQGPKISGTETVCLLTFPGTKRLRKCTETKTSHYRDLPGPKCPGTETF